MVFDLYDKRLSYSILLTHSYVHQTFRYAADFLCIYLLKFKDCKIDFQKSQPTAEYYFVIYL